MVARIGIVNSGSGTQSGTQCDALGTRTRNLANKRSTLRLTWCYSVIVTETPLLNWESGHLSAFSRWRSLWHDRGAGNNIGTI